MCFGERGERSGERGEASERQDGSGGDGARAGIAQTTACTLKSGARRPGTLSRSWTLRFQLNDKRRDMGLGSYPTVTLTEAQKEGQRGPSAYRSRRRPPAVRTPARKATRQAQKPIPTFREIAKLVIADAQAKSTNAKVRYQWERHLGPTIAARCSIARRMRSRRLTSPRSCARSGDPSPRSRASSIRRFGACSTAPASSSAMSTASR